jgi:hypothetical protein
LRLAIPWHWPLVITLALYLGSALVVIVSRLRYSRRRRLLGRVEDAVNVRRAHDGEPAELSTGDAAWDGISAQTVVRMSSENRLSRAVGEATSRFIVSAAGVDEVSRVASGKGRISRWRRVTALRVLALARPGAALPVLEEAMRDPDTEVVAVAASTLGRLRDPAAADILVRALERGYFPASRLATFLERIPLLLPESLRPLLQGPTATVRYWGAVLGRRYKGLGWMEDELRRLALDEAPAVRKAALQSLAAVGAPGTEELAAGALSDESWFVRAHAARALGELRAAGHARPVAALLADREWWVRQAAKEALVRMGRDAEPAILEALSNADRFARNSAAEVMQDTGIFERLLKDGALGTASPTEVDALRRACDAGGSQLIQSVVARLPEELRPRAFAVAASARAEAAS